MKEFNDDLLDEGLQGVMGKDRCQNLCGEQSVSQKKTVRNVVVSKKEKAMDAKWEPVKVNRTDMDKLKACAQDALLYGCLSSVFFYFQMAEQMTITASMICIVTCVLVGGVKIGKHSVEA